MRAAPEHSESWDAQCRLGHEFCFGRSSRCAGAKGHPWARVGAGDPAAGGGGGRARDLGVVRPAVNLSQLVFQLVRSRLRWTLFRTVPRPRQGSGRAATPSGAAAARPKECWPRVALTAGPLWVRPRCHAGRVGTSLAQVAIPDAWGTCPRKTEPPRDLLRRQTVRCHCTGTIKTRPDSITTVVGPFRRN